MSDVALRTAKRTALRMLSTIQGFCCSGCGGAGVSVGRWGFACGCRSGIGTGFMGAAVCGVRDWLIDGYFIERRDHLRRRRSLRVGHELARGQGSLTAERHRCCSRWPRGRSRQGRAIFSTSAIRAERRSICAFQGGLWLPGRKSTSSGRQGSCRYLYRAVGARSDFCGSTSMVRRVSAFDCVADGGSGRWGLSDTLTSRGARSARARWPGFCGC